MIDSVQTLTRAELGSAPGSVAQVREAAGRLLRVAKEAGVAIFLVGHVTKDGAVAGPRVLEHLVDCVLQFEGDRYREHRILRAAKNRFGSTNEIGVFEMTGAGLVGVPDPSALFGRTEAGEVGSAVACALEGTRPILLEIQALVAPTDLAMPRRVAHRGRPEAARDARRGARAPRRRRLGQRRRLRQRRRRRADRRAGRRPRDRARDRLGGAGRAGREGLAAFGEVGLTGRLRPATQAERRLEECAKLGFGSRSLATGTAAPAARAAVVEAETALAIGAGLEPPRPSAALSRGFRAVAGTPENAWKLGIFPSDFRYTGARSPADFDPPASCATTRDVREGEAGLFEVGDKVVYPHHGAGTVVKKEVREVLGQKREYLTIKILHNDMTVNVPTRERRASGPAPGDRREMVEVREGPDRLLGTRCRRTGTAGSSTTATR